MLRKVLLAGCLAALASATENPGDDPLDWLRNSIPGEPGVDYPIFSTVQETSFSCDDKVFGGYYADPEMGCQGYHVCLLDPLAGTKYPTSFLCPNGTLFQQQIFNCDWWYNVDCAASEGLYGLAEGAFGSGGDGGSGSGGDGGQCPAANPLSDAECAGAVSNCWSPGQPDTDCPNYGLCCFDGCANTCVDGPKPEVEQFAEPQAQYVPAETTARPTPPPPPPPPQPAAPAVTEGYNYPVPDVTLPIRPVTTTLAPIIETPATLYGAPPESVPRGGRQGRQQRRRQRGGRRGRLGRRRGQGQGRRQGGQGQGRLRTARRINRDQLQETYVFVK